MLGDLPDLPDFGVAATSVNQIGIVVADVDDGMARFGRLLGLEAWRVFHCEAGTPAHTDMTYRDGDGDYSMDAAISADVTDPVEGEIELWRRDRTEIELLAPTGGTSTYSDHLDAVGEGVHHVAIWDLDDPEAVLGKFLDAGIEILQEGRVFGSRYVYLDTRELLNGVILEIGFAVTDKPRTVDSPYIDDVIVS